jgi:sterol desaturase/sphingolipid hydroxylase (fatty acid hydroxylase superfamily)/DNA-binding beta-propeller fold protein YncE
MEWMAAIGGFWLAALAWLAGLAVAFGVLVRLMPCNPGMYWWKDLRAVAADFMYWFVVPLFARLGRTLLLIAAVALLFGGREPHPLPVGRLPLWLQCVAVLLTQDVLLYWIHRAFHGRLAWKFHAVHHSPKVLDWMSAVRFHPVNYLLEFAAADVAVLLLGFSPQALLALVPFNMVYSTMVHANLNWTFGPLRYVFASPVFHRWHHTTLTEGRDKNFASTFPFLDVVFGTFHMPPGRLPEQFGTGENDVPEGFWGQLIYPFLGTSTPQARPSENAIWAALGVLAVVSVVGAGTYDAARLAAGRITPQQAPAAPRPAPENDLARASAVTAVAVSADGRLVVSGHEGGTVKVWDAATGEERLTLGGHTGRVNGVALAAEGRDIVSAAFDGTLKVWDAATGRERLTLTGHTGPVLSVAVSADGRRVASGGSDGTVRVWDGATGRETLRLAPDTDAVPGVALSADGRRVVAADFMTVRVWDAHTGREEWALQGHADLVFCVAISPDGRRVVSGSFDQTAQVWDAETGRQERTLKGHGDTVFCVAFSPDGRHVVSGGNDRTVKVWDAGTGREEVTLTGHADAVIGVAVSASASRIVSVSRDGEMRVCDTSSPPVATGGASQETPAGAGAEASSADSASRSAGLMR